METQLLANIPGLVSHFFISQCDLGLYNVSFVKSKYAKNKKLQAWDIIILKEHDLKKLLKWVVRFNPKKWKTIGFFNQKKSIMVECSCHAEIMVVFFDKKESMFYFEIYDNYWCKRKFYKKLSCEFVISVENAKKYFSEVLKKISN